jgi:hypothetical protein
MADVAGIVERAVIARLSDDVVGFNKKYAALVKDGGAYPGLDAVSFDFSDSSNNFNRARVPMGLVVGSSAAAFPYLMLEVRAGQNGQGPQQLKMTQYSGSVSVELEIAHSWAMEGVGDFSTEPNAAIAAMLDVFNALPGIAWYPDVVYNGGISFVKGPVQFAAENWLRSTVFTANFYVVVQ